MLDNRKVIIDDLCCLNNSTQILAASSAGSVDGITKAFDTGGGYTDGMFVVDVDAYAGNSAAASTHTIDIILEGSTTSTFTAYAALASFRLGQNAADFAHTRLGAGYTGDASTGCSFTPTTVVLKKPFHNMFADAIYRWLRVYCAFNGTVDSTSIKYSAWISKL